ncbi:hypothetical protein SeMB42_g04317 [Synchytrium endobioticum]|uniref:Secreted protein n=1 Tax=Synchytrium endobioticum TaxID=286115 RepID=A0A507CNL4_9FUNG|nr:hypothetical protein SeLEV6574_g06443 [Synchytrium endobioticum]TPX44499.1 hypothetical protein SeMB42_g04317 [Synchytrium endobioticum]
MAIVRSYTLILALAALSVINTATCYNYTDNIVYVRGAPFGSNCSQNADGSATFQLRFWVKSKGAQPDGGDAVVMSFGCANQKPIKLVPNSWFGCRNPSSTQVGTGPVTCGLADDVSDYGGRITCPDTSCSAPTPFNMTAKDKTGAVMPVVGPINAPQLNCTANDQVNLVQMNNDWFCWGKPPAIRSVGMMALINCNQPFDKFPTITATFNMPINGTPEIFGLQNSKIANGSLTWTPKKNNPLGGALLKAGTCDIFDNKTRHGLEPVGQELRLLSCKASLDGKDVPCTIGLDNIGGNTKFYEWVGTGPAPFPLTASVSNASLV